MTDTLFRRLSIALVSFLVIGGFFAISPNQSQAQTFDGSIETRDIQLTLDPETPGTNEEVRVSVDSYVVNVNRMRITWFVDGEVVASGIGQTEITVTTRDQGDLTRVEAYIQVDTETNLRKWIQIAPADLDILWQADTYTPPFYRGKALPTPESFITIIGLPNLRNAGAQSQQHSVVYTWRHNGENLSDESGYGANPLVIRNDFLDLEERVELSVVHSDGYSRANRTITIPITNPLVNLYASNSYLRNANRSIDTSLRREITLLAEPYYYSVSRDFKNLLRYTWFINEQTLSADQLGDQKFILPIRSVGDSLADVAVGIEHPLKPLQLAPRASIRVIQ